MTDTRRFDAGGMAALQAAFDEMNAQSGLTSELNSVETFFSSIQEMIAASSV